MRQFLKIFIIYYDKMTINIGKKEFSSSVKAKEYVRRELETIGSCRINNGDEKYELFCDLLKNHPTKSGVLGKIKGFEVQYDKFKNKQVLYYTENERDVFSWVICCSKRGRTVESNIKRCMRTAIKGDIIEFSNLNRRICNYCKTTEGKFEIDHIYPFQKLADEFLLSIPKKEYPVKFTECDEDYFNIFHDDDFEFKNRWIEFHKKHSKLQVLCKRCNLKKSNK